MHITEALLQSTAPAIGVRVLQRLANVELVFEGQSLFGHQSIVRADEGIGGLAVPAKRRTVRVAADDLRAIGGLMRQGRVCTIAGSPQAWVLACDPTWHHQAGQATLELERA